MNFSFALELVTAVLLVATIAACFALHRRVSMLRATQGEMARAIEGFNAAAAKAEVSIARMREAAEVAGVQLQKEIDRARAVAEDLAVAVRSGDRIIARLTQSAEAGRRG
jgi:hypothetical protein